jgi:hypothetical protein
MSREARFRGILMMVQCHDADSLSEDELYEVARICISRLSLPRMQTFQASLKQLVDMRIINKMDRKEED